MDLPLSLERIGRSARGAAGSATVLVVGAVAAQGMMALALLLIARHLGAGEYGRYTASFSACTIAAVLFTFGLDSWLLREGAHAPGELSRNLGRVLAFKLAVGLPWAVAITLLLPLAGGASFPVAVVAVAALATLADGLFTAVQTAFKAALRNRLTAATLAASRALILVGAAFLAAAGYSGAAPFAVARLAAVVVGLALCLPFVRVARARAGVAGLAGLGKASLPFAVNDLLAIIYVQADIVIVALILGSQAAGLYAPASSLVNALFVIPSAVYSVATPVLVRALVSGDRRRLKAAFTRAMLAFAAIGAALTVVAAASAGTIVPALLGRSYLASGGVLAILSPILVLKSLSFGAAALLVAVGWQRERAVPQAAAMLANVGLNFALAGRYGITAVAWVYVASEVLLLVGYAMLARRWWRRCPLAAECRP